MLDHHGYQTVRRTSRVPGTGPLLPVSDRLIWPLAVIGDATLGHMGRRFVKAAWIALASVMAAFGWLWIGSGSLQPCRPAPPWDDLAIWMSGSLGAGETDGPAGAPAFCEIPTDFTWLVALGILLLAVGASVYVVRRPTTRGTGPDS